MWEASVSAAQQLFSPGPLIAFAIITPLALFNGVMIAGGVPVFILLLSFASQLDPFIALPAAVFYAAANDATEPIPSILIGVPGSRGSQATIIDGYPMARQGRAGEALGAVYLSSLIGGLVGAACLMAVLPVAREILKVFGSAEFFLLGLLGIATVALLSTGAMVKGLLTAAFGLAIALIGFSPISGEVRADLGIGYLWEGLPLVPMLLGLFAIPELANLVVSNTSIATDRLDEVLAGSSGDVKKGMRAALRHKWLIVRSSLIGAFVGMMPGLGAVPAHWIAYAQARQTEKGASETFGTGDIRGVIAPEASNNSFGPNSIFLYSGKPANGVNIGNANFGWDSTRASNARSAFGPYNRVSLDNRTCEHNRSTDSTAVRSSDCTSYNNSPECIVSFGYGDHRYWSIPDVPVPRRFGFVCNCRYFRALYEGLWLASPAYCNCDSFG